MTWNGNQIIVEEIFFNVELTYYCAYVREWAFGLESSIAPLFAYGNSRSMAIASLLQQLYNPLRAEHR